MYNPESNNSILHKLGFENNIPIKYLSFEWEIVRKKLNKMSWRTKYMSLAETTKKVTKNILTYQIYLIKQEDMPSKTSQHLKIW